MKRTLALLAVWAFAAATCHGAWAGSSTLGYTPGTGVNFAVTTDITNLFYGRSTIWDYSAGANGAAVSVGHSLQVTGEVGNTASVSGNPVLIGGSDGSNVHNILTDSSGHLLVAQFGAPWSVSFSGGVTVIQPTAANLNATVVQSSGTNLHVNCDAGCSSSPAPGDESSFTPGTTSMTPIGGFFQTTATSNALTSGQMGALQLTSTRAAFTNLRNASGTEIGTASTPLQVSLANTGSNSTSVLVGGAGSAGTPSGGVLTVQGASGGTGLNVVATGAAGSGSAVTGNPVLMGGSDGTNARSIATNTSGQQVMVGAGTAGSASGGVITVQGVASMTPFLVNPGTAANWGVFAQTTSTSGAAGVFVMGAATTASPTYTTNQINPLSLDTLGNLRINCTTGCSSSGGSSLTDEGAFTQGSTSMTVAGGLFTTSITNLTSGQAGALRSTNDRKLMVDTPNVEATGVTTGATAATSSLQIGGVFNTSPPTLTTGQMIALQLNSAGSLHTTVDNANSNGPASAASSSPIVQPILNHGSVTALGTSLIAKGSAGNLNGFNCTGIAGAATGYCIAYNGTTAPSTGALTGSLVLDACFFDNTARGCSLSHINGSIAMSTGIVILMTSAASPFTYTTGTLTGFISADYD